MKLSALLGLFGLSALAAARDYDNNDYYVLHLDEGTEPEQLALRLGLKHDGQLGALDDHHVFSTVKSDEDVISDQLHEHRRRRRDTDARDLLDSIRYNSKQKPRMHLEKRTIPPPPPGWVKPRAIQHADNEAAARLKEIATELEISDPIFQEQWHLFNPVQLGHDVNVTGIWLEGVTGHNVTVALVDDGLDFHSQDLAPNYFAAGSWDFNDKDPDPLPELSDDTHGTRCAGEVSAARNDACGVGVAYDSKVAGIRILSKPISDADEAESLMYKYDENDIYSCSWGPPDDGRSMEAPDTVIKRAMLQSVQKGRGGLGSIYVFASGNGDISGDNCNFDGYTNSIYSITVGAVDRAGQHPYYSEHCCAQLVVTYSSGSDDAIHTTDVGENSCYDKHGGTSAAAPLAAGIFALVLQVRPDLTWRDMQWLAMLTSVKVDDGKAEWQTTTMNREFSHTFGYGKLDSYALVDKARDWEKVKPQAWYFSPWIHVKQKIPQEQEGVHVAIDVTEDMLQEANLERVEHVTLTMNVRHTRRGDLSVDLISPDGIVSHMATARKNDEHLGGYDDWTFMSVAHWGESGIGTWTVVVNDEVRNKHKGSVTDLRLKLWGESIDPDKTTLLPMPNENDDDDHDKVQTSTVTATQVSTAPAPTRVQVSHTHTEKPSDHPHRPTKPASEPSSTIDDSDSSTAVAQEPTETPSEDSNWISWLPSFGASKKTQMWIYGAVALIILFCVGLGAWLIIARRRRQRNDPRNSYEFEMLNEGEADGLTGHEKATTGRRRRRGGELYDAFAGGSEDEFSDDSEDEYRDRQQARLDGDEEDQYTIGGDSDDESDASVDEKAGRR